MRQRAAAPSSKLDTLLNGDTDILDDQEQDDVIDALETEHIQQARLWRVIFGLCAAALALFFMYATADQLMNPWQKRYTGELRTVISKQTCVAALFVQALGLAAAALSLLTCLPRKGEQGLAGCLPAGHQAGAASAASIAFSGAAALYWGQALRASVAKYGTELGSHWDLLWLPLGPLLYCLLCAYVRISLQNSSKEVVALRHYKYRHMKA